MSKEKDRNMNLICMDLLISGVSRRLRTPAVIMKILHESEEHWSTDWIDVRASRGCKVENHSFPIGYEGNHL
jgi:hypothetical protein